MKIPTITHTEFKTEKNDVPRSNQIKNEEAHPFFKDREYIRALNAVKLQRLHSKPFVKSLSKHNEGINSLSLIHNFLLSTSFDGQILLWNPINSEVLAEWNTGNANKLESYEKSVFVAFKNQVKKIGEIDENGKFLGKKSKKDSFEDFYQTKTFIKSISIKHNQMAIGHGTGVDVIDIERNKADVFFKGVNVNCVEFSFLNSVFGYGSGNEVVFADSRVNSEFLRIPVGLITNSIKFNPGKNGQFGVANEDKKVYMFDIRYPNSPLFVFKHHNNAVTSIDYSFDGKILVSGSGDKSIRVFDLEKRRCKDVYYNKRMNNVNDVKIHNNFIYSGSDDGAVRVWRVEGWKKEEMNGHEKNALEYREKLIEKYSDVGEINRIMNHRFLPSHLRRKK